MSGRYLGFEGVEGAGKSTVAAAVAAWLTARGEDVLAVREPGGTATGERIRRVLLDPDGEPAPWAEALLFAAARSELAAKVIRPALEAGRWVVSDRSVYSSLAYQGVGRGLGIDVVRTVNAAGLDGVWPDLVVLLRLSPEVGLDRQSAPDRIGGAGMGLHRRVAEGFDELAAAEQDRFLVVEASRPVDDVIGEVCGAVEERWAIPSTT